MLISNFTGGGKQIGKLEQLICTASVTNGIHEHLIYISAFDIFLSITAFLGNALILVALRKETSLHPPSKLLYRCLATTDLCVGLIVEPVYVTYLISMAHEKWNLCRHALATCYVVGYMLCSVTLLTLTAISVDRLLALSLGLRYRQVVTLKRTYVTVATFWVVSSVASISYLANHQITIWYGHMNILFCVVTSIFSYLKIFLTLRHHQAQVQDHVQQQQQPNQAIPLNIARYRKAVSSALWVQLTFVACYSPYGIIGAFAYSNLSSSNVLAWSIATTFVFLNSSLNPFLYCWKISEVKQAVKQTIRDALCCLSS
ncbi:melanocyte-stimulating hormone receptor-like [Oculina patagonica]